MPYTTGRMVLRQTPIWDPSFIETALWLDAADASTITETAGTVSQWDDKSGNGYNATAFGDPQINQTGSSTGLPAIELDGTGDYFISSVTGLQSFTDLEVFFVGQSTAAANINTNSWMVFTFGNFNPAWSIYPENRCIGYLSTTSAFEDEYSVSCGYGRFGVAERLGSSTYRRTANTAVIESTSYSTSGHTFFQNGTAVGLDLSDGGVTVSSDFSPASTGYTVDDDLCLGMVKAGAIVPTPAMKFSEFVALPTVASTEDRQKMEGYLAHKWGLTASLPGGHPYENVPPAP